MIWRHNRRTCSPRRPLALGAAFAAAVAAAFGFALVAARAVRAIWAINVAAGALFGTWPEDLMRLGAFIALVR